MLLDADASRRLLDDFRPDAAMVFPVGRDRRRIVAQIDRQHVALMTQSTTLCRDSPRPSMPSSTTSPAFRYTGVGLHAEPDAGRRAGADHVARAAAS